MTLRPNVEYVGLDLTLIGYIKISVKYRSRIIRHIGMLQLYQDNTNPLGMMQITRPLRLKLSLRYAMS